MPLEAQAETVATQEEITELVAMEASLEAMQARTGPCRAVAVAVVVMPVEKHRPARAVLALVARSGSATTPDRDKVAVDYRSLIVLQIEA